jgi:hypothetical protein
VAVEKNTNIVVVKDFKTGYWLILLALAGLGASCERDIPEPSGIKNYYANDLITNPPDSFLVNMPLKNAVSVKANYLHDSSIVWRVSQLTANNALVWFTRTSGSAPYYIISTDTIGLESEIEYEIHGDNNNYPEEQTLILRFDRLPIPFEAFTNNL